MLTSYADDQALFRSISAGASGYLLKEVHGQELVHAVREVAAGRSLLTWRPRSGCCSGCAVKRCASAG